MTFAIVPAAGKGRRLKMSIPKAFVQLIHKPILILTLERLSLANIDNIFVVVNPNYINYTEELLKEWNIKKISAIVEGGQLRQDSVYKGILQINKTGGGEVLVIHDAARPFFNIGKLNQAIEEVKQKEDACIFAHPTVDTIKTAKGGYITSTFERSKLYCAQTPQVFKFKVILESYQRAYEDEFFSTDDSALVERLGYKVKIIESDSSNIKITTPEDLMLAQLLAKRFE